MTHHATLALSICIYISGILDLWIDFVVTMLSALGQDTRPEAIEPLLQNKSAGLLTGEVGPRLHVPQNTMSARLATLSQAGSVARSSIASGRASCPSSHLIWSKTVGATQLQGQRA